MPYEHPKKAAVNHLAKKCALGPRLRNGTKTINLIFVAIFLLTMVKRENVALFSQRGVVRIPSTMCSSSILFPQSASEDEEIVAPFSLHKTPVVCCLVLSGWGTFLQQVKRRHTIVPFSRRLFLRSTSCSVGRSVGQQSGKRTQTQQQSST